MLHVNGKEILSCIENETRLLNDLNLRLKLNGAFENAYIKVDIFDQI